MQTKGVVFIVKYVQQNGDLKQDNPREATLNVNFNKQEIWYLENEVGIGGTVSVLITPSKCGRYINIKAVDMKSAVKGEPTPNRPLVKGEEGYTPKPDKEKFRTPKEMTANNLTDIYCRNQQMDDPKFVLDAYNYFLGEL